ncbi:MAG: condensation domain-containing protein, partial [Pikeienuella sp.]
PWELFDWRETDAEAALRALFEANRARPFDLRRPPLLRLQLAQVAEERHVMVICHHHIILDGWSQARMLRDLMSFYRGDASLPPARPYADYIRWLKRQDKTAALGFWNEYQAGSPGPSLVFGGAGERPEFVRREWAFPDALAQGASRFCAAQGVTLNTLLQGALGLYAAEALGRTDVVFGSATAGRPAGLPGVAEMVGLFINALPVRVKLDPTRPVADWLRDLQSRQAAAIEHEHVALREVQTGRGTLFDCLLVIENYPVTTGGGGGDIALDRVEFDEWTHFPLTILVAPGHAGMKLILRHDRSVLSDDALGRFTERYVALLEAITADPAAPVADLVGPLEEAAPQAPAAHAVGAARPPETETERRLAALWAELLKGGAPMAGDNFFAIGGHSLMAAKLVARLRRELDLDLPVRAIFDRPVLSDLAEYLDALQVGGAPAEGDMVVEF